MFLQACVILFTEGVSGPRGSGPSGVPGPVGVPVEILPGRLLLRAVCILLECILVTDIFMCQVLFTV